MILSLYDKRISKRYAHAFMRMYGSMLSSTDYQNIVNAYHFLQDHPELLSLLQCARHNSIQEETFIDQLQYTCTLPSSVKPLLLLLIKKNRIVYSIEVLRNIAHLYQELHGIIPFVITSAYEISSLQKDAIKKFLIQKTKASIECHWSIDTSLIGGFRAQSEYLLWECSFSKQLRIIEKKLLLS